MQPFKADRRHFVLGSTALTALGFSGGVHAAGNDVLKVGLVGCGGRGTGAAGNALKADPNVQLYALGDAFADKVEESLAALSKGKQKAKIDVPPERRFSGFDAYKKVIELCDVVLLCTPPHFRPEHLRAAIEAKRHVFCEKPVAVDAAGVRSVIESAQLAKKNHVSLCSGFCYRYDLAKREWVKRIHDGVIGDPLSLHVQYNSGGVWWNREKKTYTEKDYTSMAYQMRNWYYYTWLSGDHNVEQHIHNIDKACWIMGKYPIHAEGMGGRAVRTDAKFGNIYDHHSVVYTYDNGAKVYSFCRHQPGCQNEVSDTILATKGMGENIEFTGTPKLKPTQGEAWKYSGEAPNMYDQEHVELFAGIRKNQPINDGESAALSTLMAVMGRMATYTGQRITWDFMRNQSKENLVPPKYDMDGMVPKELAAIAVPGKTKPV
jgi:myo-inositol 2-dehydrogenase / D-chiro-inositol 1-dehydrogenase